MKERTSLLTTTEHKTDNVPSVVDNLLKKLEETENCFHEAVDSISGRFILIYKSSRDPGASIIHDATGMFKILYDEKCGAISSNIFLINKFIYGNREAEFRSEYIEHKELWKFGVLGNYTPIENVKFLTPNQKIQICTQKITRIFPRSKKQNKSSEEVAELVIENFSNQVDILRRRHSLVHSLTAGMDSRVSFAITNAKKPNQDKYFTYLFNDSHKVDACLASKMADAFEIKHQVILPDNSNHKKIFSNPYIYKQDKYFTESLSSWCWYNHSSKLVDAYKQMFVSGDGNASSAPLHIRSNLFEIGRVFWGKE